ncbi:hypothetical protein [Enterocloster clostridioformis]|jgi:hypothetical protein|nr:hypothetical protein [Enterocloster clostridioformis]MCA5580288.1 hypothetical protein [Enterocloster clostridioformis]MCI7610181.1 hypothetical protein [Enterocloster clostridioformis]MDB2129136.1 hypothetical protein [Enterocloster clostridioformis]MDU1961359.1 hypothetical protein [Enterocloster clostridioformis]
MKDEIPVSMSNSPEVDLSLQSVKKVQQKSSAKKNSKKVKKVKKNVEIA